ncbi:hypothetical protein [Pontiella agarivorans]|uniref:Uncharacterized protein n=1 Tax=Pontiella agarivorans TaxID=3038953 RepID=A0ABU5N0S2_9BACT|nr:hypothetical protein [Pontiella agarivorans]MDZ8119956.1 hypothetical protein [Pontiella agarivorans]
MAVTMVVAAALDAAVVTVDDGAVLSGSGVLSGSLVLKGALSPGSNQPLVLTSTSSDYDFVAGGCVTVSMISPSSSGRRLDTLRHLLPAFTLFR